MQELIVAVIVVLACWATLKRYLPRAARLAVSTWLATMCHRLGWLRLERALRQSAAQAQASAAGACGSCKDCAQGDQRPAATVQASITAEALRKTIRR